MKLSHKQRIALERIRYFIPPIDWSSSQAKSTYSTLGLKNVQEDLSGVDAVFAFFQLSEQGKCPDKVKNLSELARLISGLRWMTTHIQLWKEGFSEGTLHPDDFIQDSSTPSSVISLAKRACEDTGRIWRLIGEPT